MKDGDINGYVDGGHLATRAFDVYENIASSHIRSLPEISSRLGHVPTLADILCHFSASESIRKLEDVAHGMINQRVKAQLDHAADISSSLLVCDPSYPSTNDPCHCAGFCHL